MSAMTSSSNTFFSSPRNQRMMLWISGAVLLIAIAVFLGVFFLRANPQPASRDIAQLGKATDTNPYVNGTKPQPRVAPAKDALAVARTFLETAVARKNLAVAYGIVGPFLKSGTPRAQWIRGNNPVQPVPDATNLKTATLKVKSSTKNALMLEVGPLLPKKGKTFGGLPSLSFQLEVDRIGGKWLVNYFIDDYRIGVLANPGNNMSQ